MIDLNKRIIICGPCASGKTILRKRLEDKGFKFEVSYTTREPRTGEINGIHYNFISKDDFKLLIEANSFYEWTEFDGHYYGTGNLEWNTNTFFIMETDGINHINKEDRKNCFIIYINNDEDVRISRMVERGWDNETINKRLQYDKINFKNFSNYDILITNSDF